MTSPLNIRKGKTILWQRPRAESAKSISDEEAERVLKGVPVIPGDDTVFEVFKEKEEDR